MTIEVKVPRLPESVADATLVSWHKGPGDVVERDENLADLETDKVVLEVPAPIRGVLKEIRVEGGATVTSGQLLAMLEPAGEGARAAPPAAAGQPAAKKPAAAPVAAETAGDGRGAGKSAPSRREGTGHRAGRGPRQRGGASEEDRCGCRSAGCCRCCSCEAEAPQPDRPLLTSSCRCGRAYRAHVR